MATIGMSLWSTISLPAFWTTVTSHVLPSMTGSICQSVQHVSFDALPPCYLDILKWSPVLLICTEFIHRRVPVLGTCHGLFHVCDLSFSHSSYLSHLRRPHHKQVYARCHIRQTHHIFHIKRASSEVMSIAKRRILSQGAENNWTVMVC